MSTHKGSADHITLTVPARSEFARTARLTAAALLSRLEIGYDDLDDVKTATEEAFIYACESGPESGEVSLHFYLEGDTLKIEVPVAVGSSASSEEAERRTALADFILEGVCDSYEMSSDETGTWLKLTKELGPVSADAG